MILIVFMYFFKTILINSTKFVLWCKLTSHNLLYILLLSFSAISFTCFNLFQILLSLFYVINPYITTCSGLTWLLLLQKQIYCKIYLFSYSKSACTMVLEVKQLTIDWYQQHCHYFKVERSHVQGLSILL